MDLDSRVAAQAYDEAGPAGQHYRVPQRRRQACPRSHSINGRPPKTVYLTVFSPEAGLAISAGLIAYGLSRFREENLLFACGVSMAIAGHLESDRDRGVTTSETTEDYRVAVVDALCRSLTLLKRDDDSA